MATFTSVQNGVWEDGATWGNSSPGTPGTDFPGVNDDVANVGHEVDYDAGVSDITWGNITITTGGVFIVPIDADSRLRLNATGVFEVEAGAELRAGTAIAPIDKAYAFQFWPPQGATERYVLNLYDTSKISIYGDPDYYGSDPKTELAVNWTTGQTFTVVGDYTSKWQAGQRITVHRNYGEADEVADHNTDYQTDVPNFTIDTLAVNGANTDITINEANPGFTCYAGGNVTNISRNIEFADPASPTALYGYNGYTNRIWMFTDQYYYYTDYYDINIHDVVFRGWSRAIDAAGYGGGVVGTGLVFYNNDLVLRQLGNSTLEGYFYSNAKVGEDLFYDYDAEAAIKGDVFANHYGFTGCEDMRVEADIYENWRPFYENFELHITGDLYRNFVSLDRQWGGKVIGDFNANLAPIVRAVGVEIVGDFNYNLGGMQWSTDVTVIGNFANQLGGTCFSWCRRCMAKGADFSNIVGSIVSTEWWGTFSAVLEDCTIDGVDRLPLRVYCSGGLFLPLTSGDGDWQAPPSGSSWILQATPNSYNIGTNYSQMILSPLEEMADYVSAGSKTLTFRIYPVGWATALDQDDIFIEVRYLDSVSGVSRTTVVTGAGSFVNGGWRNLTASFSPSQAGVVYFNLFIRRYESGAYVLIDPEWVVT